MQSSDSPTRFVLPFAANAAGIYVRAIPVASQVGVEDGRASFTDGFPPVTFVPIEVGGTPPFGSDFNGLLQQLTAGVRWLQAGGPMPFSSAFAAAIGGYPSGAIIASAVTPGLLWISTANANTSDPDAGGANWLAGSIANARIRLGGNITFYVSPAGSDSNSGLSSGAPWATLQKAATTIYNLYDLNGYTATVRIAAGTFSAGALLNGAVPGSAGPQSVVFEAIDGTVTVNGVGYAFAANQGAMLSLSGSGFVMTTTLSSGLGSAVIASGGAKVAINGTLNFGASAISHVLSATGGQVSYAAAETVSGGAQSHLLAHSGGTISANGVGVTLVGTPAFSTAYATADQCGIIEGVGYTVLSGSATGDRYSVITNGVINVGGGGANVFPGSNPGSDDTGGQYV